MKMRRDIFLTIFIVISIFATSNGDLNTNKDDPKPTESKTFVLIGNETFYIAAGLSEFVPWYSAQKECQDLKMQLVTLDTEERWTMISDWLLQNPKYDNWLWTSGQRLASQEEYVWTTKNKTFEYTAWNPGEPSLDPSSESCVNFHAKSGGWEDDDCTTAALMFMCERNIS